MQGNKTQDFIVTAIGKGDVSSLLVSEKELLFSTLLQRMIEFAQGGADEPSCGKDLQRRQ